MTLTKTHNRMIDGSLVNVKDFGAIADNSTNNTAVVQNAIDSISEYGGTVYISECCNFTFRDLTGVVNVNCTCGDI